MEQEERLVQQKYKDQVITFLESLKTTIKQLQTKTIFISNTPPEVINNIEALLVQSEEISTSGSSDQHPYTELYKLFQLLTSLKSLLQILKEESGVGRRGFSLKSFIRREIACYKIHKVSFKIEGEIKAFFDREFVRDLVFKIEGVGFDEEEKVRVLEEFGARLSKGFDREFQEIVLKRKVFSVLESSLCNSECATRVRELAALDIVALVRFSKDVFVGLVLMGSTIQALISMASCCTIQALCSLVGFIRTPLVDIIELQGEIPRIVSLLSSQDLAVKVAAFDCVCLIAFYSRFEVVEAMLGQELIEKLMELQRSELGDNLVQCGQDPNGECCEEVAENEEDECGNPKNRPFSGCVSKFAVQVEVGEGLCSKERNEVKAEILRRIRDSSVSEAECATVVAEVLWGSSP